MVHVAPMGAQGEGSRGPKPCKFQSNIFSRSRSRTVMLSNTSLCEELKLFMAVPRVAPMGPGAGGNCFREGEGAYVKSNCFMNLILQNACLDFKQT